MPQFEADTRLHAGLGGFLSEKLLALSGLQGCWQLGELTGTVAEDLSGNGRDGTWIGSPALGDTPGGVPEGGSVTTFDSTDDYVEIGDVAALRPTTALTLVALVKFTSVATTRYIVGSGDTGLFGFLLTLNGGVIECRIGNGAAAILLTTGAVTTGVWYFVVVTYSGTTGTLYLNGSSVDTDTLASPISYTGITTTRIGQANSINAARYFNGMVSHVAICSEAASSGDVSSLYAATQWTDISSDVDMGAAGFDFDYGITGSGPLDRIAPAGALTWAMKNSAKGSRPIGYYTVGHVNARSGWEIGIPIRVAQTYGGTTYYKWRGTLVEANPSAGEYGRRIVSCLAVDWMDDASIGFVNDVAIQTNKRVDQLARTLLTAAGGKKPAAIDFETGQSTFAYAFDNARDERTPLIRAFLDGVVSEVGYMYPKGDTTQGGTLKLEDRHFRPLQTTPAASFNKSMYDVAAVRSRANVINHILAVVHPRAVDAAATTVLYTLAATSTKPEIKSGETLPLTVFFRDSQGRFVRVAGTDIVTPVAGTDYVANTQPDGSGSVVTGNLSIAFNHTSNSASIAFTNNGLPTAYLTTLQVRGKAVQDRYELAVTSRDAQSIRKYGERDLTYDMPYEDRLDMAKGVAEWIDHIYGAPMTFLSEIVIKANKSDTLMTQALVREPGDRIEITEAMSGIATGDYFINGVRANIRAGQLMNVSWTLAPAGQLEAWILEVSLLQEGTILGFL